MLTRLFWDSPIYDFDPVWWDDDGERVDYIMSVINPSGRGEIVSIFYLCGEDTSMVDLLDDFSIEVVRDARYAGNVLDGGVYTGCRCAGVCSGDSCGRSVSEQLPDFQSRIVLLQECYQAPASRWPLVADWGSVGGFSAYLQRVAHEI